MSATLAAVYLLLEHTSLSSHYVTMVACGCGLTLRLLAIRFGWQMPKFVYHEDWH